MIKRRHHPAGRLISLAFVLALSAVAARAEIDSPPVRVDLTDGRLSVEADQIPLQTVLEAIARSAGFTVELRGEITEAVSPSIRDLPINAAISELLGAGRHSFFLQFAARDPGQKSPRIARLVVIAANPGAARARSERASEAPLSDPPTGGSGDPTATDEAAMEEAIEILEQLLREEDVLLRDAAAEALSDLDDIAIAN